MDGHTDSRDSSIFKLFRSACRTEIALFCPQAMVNRIAKVILCIMWFLSVVYDASSLSDSTPQLCLRLASVARSNYSVVRASTERAITKVGIVEWQ